MHLDEDKFPRSQGDTFLFDLFSNKLHISAENTVLYLLFYPSEILIANTPLLIKYVKSEQKSKIREKEKLKRKRQYFIALTIKEKNVRNQNLRRVK
jgi:hypothetical protein